MAMMIGPANANSLKPQGKIDCHPNSTCPECKAENAKLSPRERLVKLASYNLRHPVDTMQHPVRSLTDGADAVWSALTKW